MMICKSKMIFWIFLCSPLIVKAKDEFDDFFEFSDDPHPTEVLIDEFAHTIQLANGLSTQLEDKVKESPANNEIETLTVQLNDVTQEMSSVMSGVMIKAMKEASRIQWSATGLVKILSTLESLNQEGMKSIQMVQNKKNQ